MTKAIDSEFDWRDKSKFFAKEDYYDLDENGYPRWFVEELLESEREIEEARKNGTLKAYKCFDDWLKDEGFL